MMSAYNSSDDDEQMARDMQFALDLQAKEERRAEKNRKKRAQRNQDHHSPLEDGYSRDKLNADHMLFVSCLVDGKTPCDLLVDTGASTSAMSTDMVFKLGLESKMNQSVYGNAKGVGNTSIVGIIENVDCMMGHVEFRLFFMVLEGSMPYAILGLDQMRRFKCQVDLDDNVLLFGGKSGVSVPFMPQGDAMIAAQKMMCMGEHGAATQEQNGLSGMLQSLFKK
jgi:hypothetical protein